tara:strand:+ start:708 stop:1016 length:309 start_codon:yes stop_codon:yes gene_type:complete
MLIKKIIFLSILFLSYSLLTAAEKNSKPPVVETIKFKELTEFDACFLIYRSAISFNMKDMLKDYMKFREFECSKYEEILKRASIVKGSLPKKSKAYKINKKK